MSTSNKTVKREGARSYSMAQGGSNQIFGIGFKSVGSGHSSVRQHMVVMPNPWIKFSTYRILARGGSVKFLVLCFWPYVEL